MAENLTSFPTRMHPVLQSLPVLILSPHARCNCRCIMCDIWKRTCDDRLSVEDVERLLDDVQNLRLEWVVLSGGEPLMHSDLFDICRALRRRGIRVTLLSTGLLLHRYAEQITAHVNDVIVSLDGPPAVHDTIRRVPGAFTIFQEGIRRLLEIDPAFPISARCVVQQLNHGLLIQTAACAQALGLRSISFLAADLTSEAFNRPNGWPQLQQQQIALTLDQLDVLADQFRQISQRWNGSGFVLESPDKLQRIIDHFSAHLGLCAPQSPRCNAPWTSAVVEADGSVRPCFFHPPIGSLKHLALSQILNGPQAIAFRHSLDVGSNPICQRCVCSLNWKRAGVQETSCI